MKKSMIKMIALIAISVSVLGCKDKAKEANTTDAEMAAEPHPSAVTYMIQPSDSQIEWKGFKPTATHHGIIKIKEGKLQMDDDVILSGVVMVDMTSLEDQDLEGDDKLSLENHLKGTVEGKEGDFFNVTKYPTATFEITGVSKAENGMHALSGNLTMKGVKNNITFPVKMTTDNDMLTLESESFVIDRTKWGVNYGSKSIFDNLGDKFINDDIELKIMVKAKKA